MAALEITRIDIESGHRSSADNSGATNDGEEKEEEEEAGIPNLSDAYCSVDVESGDNKVDSEKVEKECRICQLSLFSSSPGSSSSSSSSGVAIELGCSCKHDLAVAHKHCAETWFKIKGNKICEICNSIAQNVNGPIRYIDSGQQDGEISTIGSNTSGLYSAAARRCLNGHRFLNFMLACMVFAFVISWLFHFNIPS